MTIELSPEVEAQISEMLKLWGWDAGDHALVEACALGMIKHGVCESIKLNRELDELRAIAKQSVPDAREITCKVCGKLKVVFIQSKCHTAGLCVDCYWDAQGIPAVQVVPDARVFEERAVNPSMAHLNLRVFKDADVPTWCVVVKGGNEFNGFWTYEDAETFARVGLGLAPSCYDLKRVEEGGAK